MTASPAPSPPGFPRRTLLAGVLGAAGLTLLAGCTSDDGDGARAPDQAGSDLLADQVAVQEVVVAAYAAAAAADPALGDEVEPQALQALAQLEELRNAAPGATPSSAGAGTGPAPGTDARVWLREQLGVAAGAHEEACADHEGGRAALLGSVAAGLRGQESVLA
ncbi:hypothetical protein [Trujillonella endophytica]|uniref:DUF4439 domain-containing protein n=1 Tax=Trujillonella endophytica TaxID=673521 RepID=A0A1H8TF46_9ACTN|nr:hypothetical protein [Trujillella endophytica]SEO89118.1 hypothetical protein SAMN05660991_02168 [Trujillella endophytica]